ncbi:hypothetical protein BS17DRAFT_453600 [Gyrodon lividus]|nr:hypothetical protein BS17DRAFT_453600 [Gyrodon lividus]
MSFLYSFVSLYLSFAPPEQCSPAHCLRGCSPWPTKLGHQRHHILCQTFLSAYYSFFLSLQLLYRNLYFVRSCHSFHPHPPAALYVEYIR